MRSRKRPGLSQGMRASLNFYFFISPWLLVFLGLTLFPLLWGLWLSFYNFSGFNMNRLKFMFLSNYVRAFKSPDMWLSLWHTFKLAIVNIPLGICFSLFLAILLNQKVHARALFRTVYYLPTVIPIALVGIMINAVAKPNTGLLNGLGKLLISPTFDLNWILYYPNQCLIAYLLWTCGGSVLIFLAALQNVPVEQEEAARIDGASKVQSFFYIVIPHISPVVYYQFILGFIGSLNLLVPAMLLRLPGGAAAVSGALQIPPENRLFMVYTFEQSMLRSNYSYGIALTWIIFVIIFLFSMLIVRTSRSWVFYETDVR